MKRPSIRSKLNYTLVRDLHIYIDHLESQLERCHTEQCNISDFSTRFLVRSKFCLTIVDDIERTEKEADKLVVQLNEMARQMDLGVRYEKIPVNV